MPQIDANTDALMRALGFGPEEARRRSQTLADLVLAEWSAGARNKLNSTRAAYLRSLQVRDVSPSGFICGLPASPSTAIIAHMVEQGMGSGGIGTTGPYDVRKYLLQASTRNIRRRKDGGLYLHVPFGHKAKDLKANYGSLIANAARRLQATTTDANRQTRYGGRLPSGRVPKLRSHHVTDPLAGLVRLASTYSRGAGGRARTQTSGYRTWRTASYSNTHPDAWMSSGITPRRIMDDVSRELPTLISQVY
jgi:hypothetical protein